MLQRRGAEEPLGGDAGLHRRSLRSRHANWQVLQRTTGRGLVSVRDLGLTPGGRRAALERVWGVSPLFLLRLMGRVEEWSDDEGKWARHWRS
jgi:hypothetical protein